MAQTPPDLHQTTVWGDVWNPPTDDWDPNAEDPNIFGVAEPSHGDVPGAEPISESYGQRASGTTPDVRGNLLTDVRAAMSATPPAQEVHHVVETIEPGSPIWRVRQVLVAGNVTPTQLVEENPDRKRILLRIVPTLGVPSLGLAGAQVAGAPSEVVVASTGFAAGSDIPNQTPPGPGTWQLLSVTLHLVTSATVANRLPTLVAFDNVNNKAWQVGTGIVVPASTTTDISWAVGASEQQNVNTMLNQAIPPTPYFLSPPAGGGASWHFATITQNLQAGDQYSLLTATWLQIAGTGGGGLFISPRNQIGPATAPASWWKIASSDPPLELKTTEGVDAIGANSFDSYVVQVAEEIESTKAGVAAEPGLT